MLLFSFNVHAQKELWGMTSTGGEYGAGVIFKTDGSGDNQTIEHNFKFENDGSSTQHTDLLRATDGMLYGMTSRGGILDMGVLFQYDPVTSTYTKKLDFIGSTNGSYPYGSLIQASDGKFYGMTLGGGVNDMGVLFQYDPATSTYSKKLDFDGINNGSKPWASLIQTTDGKIYGMTNEGGENNLGVLFQYDPATSVYSKKLDFDGSNGSYPTGSLMQASNGKLYGLTGSGGENYMGVLFQFDPATSVYSKKLDFEGSSNGSYPSGSLIEASDGNLYGLTESGGVNNYGVLFQYKTTTSIFTKKLNFDGDDNGSYPLGSLMEASDGKLYGMTKAGGTNYQGVIFQYDVSASTAIKKFDFAGTSNGSNPFGSLIQALDGMLYATTNSGGPNDKGVLFQYNPATSTYTKKFNFEEAIHGSYPLGTLIQASDGMLYGMTDRGGANNMGTLFQYNPITSTYTVKVDFAGASNGRDPQGSLMQASDGKLYGMTFLGGIQDNGVLFQYDPATSVYTKKIDFNGVNGVTPYGSLMQATDGQLYGVAKGGGTNSMGVMFQYNPATSSLIKKVDFAGASNGMFPLGSLIQASDGNLYGLTNSGGAYSKGVLFQYNPATSSLIKKVDFAGASNGSNPISSLMQATNGKIYGMTFWGGAHDNGVLFQYDPANSNLVVNVNFAGASNGSNPQGAVMQASNGKLYGMTKFGGTNNLGVMFQFDPIELTYTKKIDFNGANGRYPQLSTALIEINAVTLPTITTTAISGITNTTANSGGVISSDGNTPITARGICWSLLPNPTVDDYISIDATGLESFTSSITALTPGATYYVRAYATNNVGTAYGNEINFTTTLVSSLKNYSDKNTISIYPNPAKGFVNLEINSLSSRSPEIRILNVNSEIVYKKNLNINSNDYKGTIDLSSLDEGVYCIQIATNDEVITSKVILIK
jgi:uncharacterized repeat protein (TIGR03803 family)